MLASRLRCHLRAPGISATFRRHPPVFVLFGGGVNATLIPEKEDVIIVFQQGYQVGACDYVAAIPKEFADAHPGSECNAAHTLPTDVSDDENYDRGGLVVFEDGVNKTVIHLLNDGDDTRDIFDPSTWSVTGTYYLCVTTGYPCDAPPRARKLSLFLAVLPTIGRLRHPSTASPPALPPPPSPPVDLARLHTVLDKAQRYHQVPRGDEQRHERVPGGPSRGDCSTFASEPITDVTTNFATLAQLGLTPTGGGVQNTNTAGCLFNTLTGELIINTNLDGVGTSENTMRVCKATKEYRTVYVHGGATTTTSSTRKHGKIRRSRTFGTSWTHQD